MIRTKTWIVLPLFAAAACNADTAEPLASAAARPAPASTCLACHQGARSFAGQDAAAVAAKIRAILDGDVMHPPLGLDDRSDEAIAALAEALTEG